MQASGISVTRVSQWTCRLMWIDARVHDRRDREHDRRGQQSLQRPEHHLLERDQHHRQRGEHPVLDLLRVAELLHHRQRHRLDALEHDREPDHAGDEDGGEVGFAGAAAATADAGADGREDVEEHEAQEQRLDDRARDERAQVLSQHHQVAQQKRTEGDAAGTRRRVRPIEIVAGGGCGHQSRRSFPVKPMNTVSSDGGATCTSLTM